jgi:hypothetical protein
MNGRSCVSAMTPNTSGWPGAGMLRKESGSERMLVPSAKRAVTR